MSPRLTRTLLKLYPRRIRQRYGAELLNLQDQLRAQGEVSGVRLIWDMLAGALLVRSARRASLVTGAALIIGGLAVAGMMIGGRGTDPPARVSAGQVRRAARPAVRRATATVVAPAPHGGCFVYGSSCSLTPCTEFTVAHAPTILLPQTAACRRPRAGRAFPQRVALRSRRPGLGAPVFVGT